MRAMPHRWKPNVTVAALVEREGRFLLVEEETTDGLKLNNRAGHLDPGESPIQACAREVIEETAHDFTPTALIGVYRSIMPEALRFPELAKDFYDKGPGRASDRLAEVLEDAKARGEIHIGDCHAAADHFVGMFRDNLHLKVVLGLRSPPSPTEAEAAVVSAIGIFLHGIYGAGRPQ